MSVTDYPEFTAAPEFPVASLRCPMDPAPLVGELREERPVARVRLWDGSEPWLVTRHADARQALRDPRLSSDVRRAGFPFLSAAQKEAIGDALLTFIRMDPPEHTRQRRMLTQEFLIKWMEARSFGVVRRAGVECTGSYGAALARHLHAEGIEVTEVNQPDRAARRRHGKTDAVDAARAVLSGRATATAKTSDGRRCQVE